MRKFLLSSMVLIGLSVQAHAVAYTVMVSQYTVTTTGTNAPVMSGVTTTILTWVADPTSCLAAANAYNSATTPQTVGLGLPGYTSPGPFNISVSPGAWIGSIAYCIVIQ